jgi:hypothetical protein
MYIVGLRLSSQHYHDNRYNIISARNGNVEVPVYFLKVKQGHNVRIMENDKQTQYISISAGMKFRNKKKFRYSMPAYTDPFPSSNIIPYSPQSLNSKLSPHHDNGYNTHSQMLSHKVQNSLATVTNQHLFLIRCIL